MSSYSKTILTQEDKSVQAAGDAENILGSGAELTQAGGGSIVVEAPGTEGDIIFNQFPKQIQDTIGSLIKTVGSQSETFGESLSRQQIGEAAELPRIVLYIVGGVGLIYLASKVLKK